MTTIYVVACAAPPTLRLPELLKLLQDEDWDPCVILTPTAAQWIDVDDLAAHTNHPVRVHPRLPHEQDPLPLASAVLAAPLTFNTLNKWAAGSSDTLALGLLNEAIGLDLPIVAAPIVKTALRQHPAYNTSLSTLRSAGVTVLDPDAVTRRLPDGTVTAEWSRLLEALPPARK
ncbi:MAG: flavoprotein [Stackebrandtia sp.]